MFDISMYQLFSHAVLCCLSL